MGTEEERWELGSWWWWKAAGSLAVRRGTEEQRRGHSSRQAGVQPHLDAHGPLHL